MHGIGFEPASVGPTHRLLACGPRVRCLVESRVYVSVDVSAPRVPQLILLVGIAKGIGIGLGG